MLTEGLLIIVINVVVVVAFLFRHMFSPVSVVILQYAEKKVHI